MAFDTATYTDVTAAESISGADGFQFQAASAGISGLDKAVIESELLHRVDPTWATSHDGNEVSQPQTVTYLERQGRYYLSRGKSTGATNSGRPGNQVTEAAATSDWEDFAPYSPAQTLAARTWTLAKSPIKEPAQWETPLEIDPSFELDQLEAMLTSDDWALATLPSLLTMVDEALSEGGRRLVLVHHDLAEVLRWIAAASLFLDAEQQRKFQFRALIDNPWFGATPVVGVSPEFGQFDLGAANWINLSERTHSEVTPSPLAEQATAWFNAGGIIDATGLLQLSRSLAPVLGAELALRAAPLLGVSEFAPGGREDWATSLEVLAELGRNRQASALDDHWDECVDAIAVYQPTEAADFALAGETIAALLALPHGPAAEAVASSTLEALAASPEHAVPFMEALSRAESQLTWRDPEGQSRATASWAECLEAASRSSLPAMFAATDRLGLSLQPEVLREAGARLASLWLDDPGIGRADVAQWASREFVLTLTADGLADRLDRGDEIALEQFSAGQWDVLRSITHQRLTPWFHALSISADPQGREQAIRRAPVLPVASWQMVLGKDDPRESLGAWTAFVERADLDGAMADALARCVSDELDAPQVSTVHGKGLPWLALFEALAARLPSVPSAPQPLRRATTEALQAATAIETALDEVREPKNRAMRNAAMRPRLWVMAFAEEVGTLLVDAADRDGAQQLADELGQDSTAAVRAYFTGAQERGGSARAVQRCLRVFRGTTGALRAALGVTVQEALSKDKRLAKDVRRDDALSPVLDEVARDFKPARNILGKLWGGS